MLYVFEWWTDEYEIPVMHRAFLKHFYLTIRKTAVISISGLRS